MPKGPPIRRCGACTERRSDRCGARRRADPRAHRRDGAAAGRVDAGCPPAPRRRRHDGCDSRESPLSSSSRLSRGSARRLKASPRWGRRPSPGAPSPQASPRRRGPRSSSAAMAPSHEASPRRRRPRVPLRSRRGGLERSPAVATGELDRLPTVATGGLERSFAVATSRARWAPGGHEWWNLSGLRGSPRSSSSRASTPFLRDLPLPQRGGALEGSAVMPFLHSRRMAMASMRSAAGVWGPIVSPLLPRGLQPLAVGGPERLRTEPLHGPRSTPRRTPIRLSPITALRAPLEAPSIRSTPSLNGGPRRRTEREDLPPSTSISPTSMFLRPLATRRPPEAPIEGPALVHRRARHPRSRRAGLDGLCGSLDRPREARGLGGGGARRRAQAAALAPARPPGWTWRATISSAG